MVISNLHQPNAVLMLFVAAVCLLGYGYPGFRARSEGSFLWIVFLLVGILAIVEWVILVFAA